MAISDFKFLWSQVLVEFSKNTSELTFENLILPLEPVQYDEKHRKLILSAPNEEIKAHWESEYAENFIEYAVNLTHEFIKSEVRVLGDVSDAMDSPAVQVPNSTALPSFIRESDLNPNFTFENFVIGESNEFAANMAISISQSPGEGANPFVIYGDVGLGKTHLMQAIGNRIIQNNPNFVVKYRSASDFMDEFGEATRKNRADNGLILKFKQRYRDVDMLMIDDIQFFAGDKAGMQLAFFDTFNALMGESKQIILTSDKIPEQMKGLEDRLLTRFAMGVSISIEKPDYETRIAILKNHIEKDDLLPYIPQDVIEWIAERVDTSVRNLEGAYKKLAAHISFSKSNEPATIEMAQKILKDAAKEEKKITVETILDEVSRFYMISVEDLKGQSRKKNIVGPRHIAMYLVSILMHLPQKEIARQFGGRDHSTVIHAIGKVDALKQKDPTVEPTINSIISDIKKLS